MKKCGIYGINNIVNDKWYIGQSTILNVRKNLHFSELRRGKHVNKHLQYAFIKYGETSFVFRILEEVGEEMLDDRERAWIIFYNSTDDRYGYNLEDGGNIQKHLSAETKRKISLALVGRPKSEEAKRNLSLGHLGVKHSEDTKRKLSIFNKGKKLSKEHKEKLSMSNKGKHQHLLGHPVSMETRKKIGLSNKGKHKHLFGRPCSEETRLKISKANKGNVVSVEQRRKISKALFNWFKSPEERRKISKRMTGRRVSVETKLKMSESHKKYYSNQRRKNNESRINYN